MSTFEPLSSEEAKDRPANFDILPAREQRQIDDKIKRMTEAEERVTAAPEESYQLAEDAMCDNFIRAAIFKRLDRKRQSDEMIKAQDRVDAASEEAFQLAFSAIFFSEIQKAIMKRSSRHE